MIPETWQLFMRISTEVLYQPYYGKLFEMIENCKARGAIYYATSGERTWADQAKLYAVGRTTGTPGHFVTKAQPGQSLHNYGLAVDFCRDADPAKDGLQPNYSDSANIILAEEATKVGLESGYYWTFQDTPHVQLPIKKHGITIADLKKWYLAGGKPEVFKNLDKYQW